MIVRVKYPKLGMGIEEGTLVRWLKNVGDTVLKGDVIAEIETAKALEEIAAPVAGRLAEILIAEGSTMAVNTTIAAIETT